MKTPQLFEGIEPISIYTEDMAVEDGILVKTDDLLPKMSQHLVSHITYNFLYKIGYIEEVPGIEQDTQLIFSKANIIDLLNQVGPRIKEILGKDHFLSMMIGDPNGNKQKVFFQLNSFGRWTIMLPEDY